MHINATCHVLGSTAELSFLIVESITECLQMVPAPFERLQRIVHLCHLSGYAPTQPVANNLSSLEIVVSRRLLLPDSHYRIRSKDLLATSADQRVERFAPAARRNAN